MLEFLHNFNTRKRHRHTSLSPQMTSNLYFWDTVTRTWQLRNIMVTNKKSHAFIRHSANTPE